MALRYTKPEHCEAASQHYSGYSCEPAPGGGNECMGVGNGGQFSDCLECLNKCNKDFNSSNDTDTNRGKKSVTNRGKKSVTDNKENADNKVISLSQKKPFYKQTIGKITIGIGSFILVLLLIFLIITIRKKRINKLDSGRI